MSGIEARIHRALVHGGGVALPDPEALGELVRAADPLRPSAAVSRSVSAIRSQLGGLGPLDPLLELPGVTDVLVNGPGVVWVERLGQLERTEVTLDQAQIALLVERIVGPLGRRADPVHALVDGRLPDGSRVHVVMPPLAVDGPCITIRRFAVRPVPLREIASAEVADLLAAAVRGRANIVVSGATGSGKTTLLNALAGLVPESERIITVEDAAELRLGAPHVVRLESRVSTADGAPEVPMRELLRNALRMRPDRLIVGEVRGAEAFDFLSALNTGHDGSLTTVHANSAADALHRLETLVLLAGMGLPIQAVRAQLVAAVDLVVHVERSQGGRRSVTQVVEPTAGQQGAAAEVRALVVRGEAMASPARARRAS